MNTDDTASSDNKMTEIPFALAHAFHDLELVVREYVRGWEPQHYPQFRKVLARIDAAKKRTPTA